MGHIGTFRLSLSTSAAVAPQNRTESVIIVVLKDVCSFILTSWSLFLQLGGHRIVVSALLAGLIQRCPFVRVFPPKITELLSDFLELKHQDVLVLLLDK